jgi:putative ABC transport system permease protein
MRELIQDVRYAVRRLLAAPLVTGAVLTSLALAIGANAAIFGAINALLLQPFPFQSPDRLVRLYGTHQERGWQSMSLSYPNFADYREQSRTLEDIAAHYVRGYTLAGIDRPERVAVVEVTSNLFAVLGVSPILGRAFVSGEDTPGAGDRVVVLTYATWQSRFGGDPDVLGRTLRLNGVEHTVVGVLPRRVEFPANDVALWTPLRHDETTWNRYSGGLAVIGRLAPGVGLEEASTEINTIAARLRDEYPRANAEVSGRLVGLAEDRYGPELRLTMYALMAAVGLMLLIACINVANLLLARAATRQSEIAVRAALGAGQARVSRLLLTESLVLGLIGGGLGLLAAVGGMALLRGAAPGSVPRLDQIQLDSVVVSFTVVVAVLTGLLFGLAPALQAARTDISSALRHGGRGRTTGAGSRRLQRGLVVAQVGLVLLVLTGAGLMTRSLGALLAVDPGFQSEGRIALNVSLTPEYDSWEKAAAYREAALERLRALPGVMSAGAVLDLPLQSRNNLWDFLIEGRASEPGRRTITGANVAGPGYFQTLGIPLLEGRTFQESDVAGSPAVALVSAAMARQFWPGGDALGKRIALPGSSGPDGPAWRTIVGVVGDVRHVGLREEGRAEMYLPFAQLTWPRRMTFVVRSAGEPGAILAAARNALWSVDDDQAVFGATTLEGVASEALGTSRSVAWLLGIFGAVALLLASVGVFGLVANSIGAALVLSRFMKGLLFGIEPLDPLTFVSAPAVLVAVALLAIWWPAWRAAQLDPVETLRAE